jgi:hypothetical protein
MASESNEPQENKPKSIVLDVQSVRHVVTSTLNPQHEKKGNKDNGQMDK